MSAELYTITGEVANRELVPDCRGSSTLSCHFIDIRQSSLGQERVSIEDNRGQLYVFDRKRESTSQFRETTFYRASYEK